MKFRALFLLTLFFSNALLAQRDLEYRSWQKVVYGQPDAWFDSEEAVRIAENVLLYQRDIGGWPKNKPMHEVLSEEEKSELLRLQSNDEDATIDNGATVAELVYLSRVYGSTGIERYKAAFLKGIEYLLAAQYPNGGWPQFYPLKDDYSRYITFNDDAMVNVMRVMRAVSEKSEDFSVKCDEKTVLKAKQAYKKGIEIILKSQVRQDGVLTVWCAQHDEVTLEPAKARTYELPSLSGSESAGIVLLLMEIENPSQEVIIAIQSAVRWFEKTKITGIRVENYHTEDGVPEKRVIADENSPPLWARFYGLVDNRPFFCDRDGVKKYSLAEIGHERRTGYAWYSANPQAVLDAFDDWQSGVLKNHEQ